MPMLSKKKRHSGHGFFSSSPIVTSSPTKVGKLSGMGHPLPTKDSAADDSPQDTRAAEPLVEDLDQVHADEDHAPVQQFNPSASDYRLSATYRSQSPAEEDAAAAPPDFTRRGIHIPTRTR